MSELVVENSNVLLFFHGAIAIRFPGLLARKHHQSIRLFDSGDGVLRFENLSFYIK